jgi:methionyl-tRNA synthetase
VVFGGDGSVGMDAVTARYEAELANDYGNLASRTIAMIRRYRDGVVPDVATDPALAAEFDGLCERVSDLLAHAEVTNALEEIWQRVRRCNRYVEERAPWQLAKDPEFAGALDQTLASLAEAVRVISVLLAAYIPESTSTLLDALEAPDLSIAGAAFAATGGGRTVAALEPLFPKRAVAPAQ